MASSFGESSSRYPQSPSCSGNNNNSDAGDFECNICFELAQDPIITLCGHLFCWPCLYKWLHMHARSPECPVCKALVQEDKLVPLYGRGKTSTDPRSKSVPGVDIPHRPTGMRPETAPPPDPNHFPHHGFGFMGGFPPWPPPGLGTSASLPALAGSSPPCSTSMFKFPLRLWNSFHGGHAHGFPPRTTVRQQENSLLTTLFLVVGAFVLFALLFT
ncbi:unnamed protein product [Spirodela intermedia]|uniref:E3 ubiquitin-protein ligase RMA n=1 Tax=Spirodela intermedia TaxID=51605 RepID=A0A7I8IZA6_SPIIN|nr:unnamed protein product [Spirodela intermedia]CAA6663042.1 unnamed protein product [Spirodela intermedia]